MSKTILILGGGVGGLVAANKLREKLSQNHRIILVDKADKHFFTPSYLWLMVGKRNPQEIAKDLSILSRKGIEYLQAEVSRIDLGNKKVQAGDRQIVYDYLIISLGAELAPELLPGFPKAALNLYTLEGAQRIRDAIKDFSGGKVIILVTSTPFKCPAAPYEAAFLLEDYFTKKGRRAEVELSIYTPEPQPMPVAGPVLGGEVRKLIEARKITYHPNQKAISIDPAKGEISFEKGEKAKFDLLISIPPHRAPAVAKEAGLLGESGWIPVDKGSLRTKFENVYAIGDIAAIKIAGEKVLPKAGVFAHYEAEVVAENIANEIKGEAARKSFSGWGECFFEIGSGKAGYASGNFYAEPTPEIRMKPPSMLNHWGKVFFEKWWLWRWF